MLQPTLGICSRVSGLTCSDWTNDFLFNLALAGAFPYTNPVNLLSPTGTATSFFTLPNIPSLVGLRIYFATVVIAPPNIVISNSTWADILDA